MECSTKYYNYTVCGEDPQYCRPHLSPNQMTADCWLLWMRGDMMGYGTLCDKEHKAVRVFEFCVKKIFVPYGLGAVPSRGSIWHTYTVVT